MQPSWEKRMLEDQQETNQLLDELGYSEGQRKLDEMVFGDDAFIDQNERRPLPTKSLGLLGSPYRSGYGGHVYAFFYYALGTLVVVLLALGIRTCAHLTAHMPASPPGTPAGPPPASAPPASSGGP